MFCFKGVELSFFRCIVGHSATVMNNNFCIVFFVFSFLCWDSDPAPYFFNSIFTTCATITHYLVRWNNFFLKKSEELAHYLVSYEEFRIISNAEVAKISTWQKYLPDILSGLWFFFFFEVWPSWRFSRISKVPLLPLSTSHRSLTSHIILVYLSFARSRKFICPWRLENTLIGTL